MVAPKVRSSLVPCPAASRRRRHAVCPAGVQSGREWHARGRLHRVIPRACGARGVRAVVVTGAITAQPPLPQHPAPEEKTRIVLDVTPQIDQSGNIILHIHPSVSEVSESTRVVNLGGQIEEIRLPLAKSTVSETDTVVRVSDGNIVAIGGLMSVDVRDFRGGIPGVPEAGVAGTLLRNAQRTSTKKELVILLKPTVIQSERDWERDLKDARSRLEALHRERERARRPQ